MAHARIDLVTLPARDTTELTIYNSQDLTLARESRTLSFTKGTNEIQFSWANTLIDPTSLQIDLPADAGLTVTDAVYPKSTRELIVWNIEATADVSAPITITYFTSGLGWSSDYVIRTSADEKTFTLQQYVTVQNNSGEDFEKAKTRVVVGEVNLVEMIRDLAQRGIMVQEQDASKAVMKNESRREQMAMDMFAGAAMPAAALMREAKEIVKKAVSEYQLYAVDGTEDILNGWGKRLPTPPIPAIPFDLSYEIDERRFGYEPIKLYKLKNTDKHELGEQPMPEGRYMVYADDGKGGLRFEGRTQHDYIPVGEDIELNLGSDGRLLFETRTVSTSRDEFEFDNSGSVSGWIEKRVVELELKNTLDRDVPVKLTHYLAGDWSFESVSDQSFEKVDAESVRWNLTLNSKEVRVINYTVLVNQGTRAR
jgi:hypothetical protein